MAQENGMEIPAVFCIWSVGRWLLDRISSPFSAPEQKNYFLIETYL